VRVLLVEDHKPLVRALRQGLEEEGLAVDIAMDGEEADFKARSAQYDAIVLDIMLPKKDGLTLLREWRQAGVKTHVLMLTARGGQPRSRPLRRRRPRKGALEDGTGRRDGRHE